MDSQIRIEKFVRDAKAMQRRETIACLIVLPIFACLAVIIPVTMLRYAFALLFLGAVAVIAMLRLLVSLRGDLTRYPADNTQHWRGEMLRMAKLLRWAPVWYLLPVVPGFILVLWFLRMVPGKSWVGHALILAAVFGFVTWLNRRSARKLEKDARLLIPERKCGHE
jgi:hypothetical protein